MQLQPGSSTSRPACKSRQRAQQERCSDTLFQVEPVSLYTVRNAASAKQQQQHKQQQHKRQHKQACLHVKAARAAGVLQ
jgi:hypothetical protein